MGDLMNGNAPLWKAFLLFLAGSFIVGVFSAIIADIPEDQLWTLVVAQTAILVMAVFVAVSAWRCALNTPTPILGWLLRFWLVATAMLGFGEHYLDTREVAHSQKVESPGIEQPRDIMREQLDLAIRNPEFMSYIEQMSRRDRTIKSGAEIIPMPQQPVAEIGREANAYLQNLRQRQDIEDATLNAFVRAHKSNPDEWAALLKMGEYAGLSRKLMEKFPAEAERRAKWDAANQGTGGGGTGTKTTAPGNHRIP
jgi:hypothetical protein